MSTDTLSPGIGRLLKLVAIVLVVAVLWVAQAVLKPLAISILLSFLLAPLVRRLERLRFHRVAAVVTVVTVVFALLGLLGWVVAGQVVDLADSVSRYRANIRAKVAHLRSPQQTSLDRASEVLDEVERELAQPPRGAARGTTATTPAPGSGHGTQGAATPTREPQPVTVVAPPETPLQFLKHTVPPLLQPLGTAAVVVVFVIFMLLGREDLRNRLIRLVGYQQLYLTTAAMDDAAQRVSTYLLMQLVVNVTYGIPVGIGLWAIGVPNALLWGMLATVLRYIPYLGPWIAASLPVVLSFAVFPGWQGTVLVVALFVVLELVSNNVVEPWLYGTRTGVSPVALLVTAVFWAWLWGPVGLVLAAPLTVCMVVVGQHVRQLEFLAVLFGDEPALSPAARLYQRLLARDAEEALELVTAQAATVPLPEVLDTTLVPALTLAEEDRHRGSLDPERARFVLDSMAEILDEVGDLVPVATATEPAVARGRIVCLPARDEADALVAAMLGQILARRGVEVVHVPVQALAGEMLDLVAAQSPRAVCISALPPLAVTHARYLCKRLRARFPELQVLIGLWNPNADLSAARQRLESAGAAGVATTLDGAADLLKAAAQRPLAKPA